jgi:PAS domain S-box-containing protein
MTTRESKPPESEESRKSLRVLLVEDNPADAELILRELKRAGFDVSADTVQTAEEFAERLRSKIYDIIVADYNLPNWTGIDALEHLRRQGKDIPFILVTGSLGDEAAVEIIKKGASDYVLKDRLARLHVAVPRALDEKTFREERLQAAEKIRLSEEEYRDLFENANDLIYTQDLEGNLTSMNRAGERILGYMREELLGKNFIEILAPDKVEEFRQIVFRKIAGEEVASYESQVRTKDGRTVTLEVNHRLIRDPDGIAVEFQGIARDITEREQLRLQFNQAQKMEAIGRLAGGVAHDFNNQLGVIIGYSDQLLDRYGTSDPLRKSVETIKEAAQRSVSLTRQLLAFSRRQIMEPQALNLSASISQVSKMLKPLIGEDVELVTNLSSTLGNVRADPTQIDQVIMNLAVNARDAMPQGGRLTLETANVELDKPYSTTHVTVQPGPYVRLSVSDTGSGMDKETQGHIFEPFFTTKERGKGTGLGLAMVYGIVKQSKGFIWVYSEPGQGTTFKIYFPRVEAAIQEDDAAEESSVSSLKGAETVLVVEDEPSLRRLTCELLQGSGYTVLAAGNGVEAIELSNRHGGPIHLLLTDAVMPGMSGRALAERLVIQRPDISVLYVSGYTDDTVFRNGLLERDMAFLQKPFTRDAFLRKVRAVLGVREEGRARFR